MSSSFPLPISQLDTLIPLRLNTLLSSQSENPSDKLIAEYEGHYYVLQPTNSRLQNMIQKIFKSIAEEHRRIKQTVVSVKLFRSKDTLLRPDIGFYQTSENASSVSFWQTSHFGGRDTISLDDLQPYEAVAEQYDPEELFQKVIAPAREAYDKILHKLSGHPYLGGAAGYDDWCQHHRSDEVLGTKQIDYLKEAVKAQENLIHFFQLIQGQEINAEIKKFILDELDRNVSLMSLIQRSASKWIRGMDQPLEKYYWSWIKAIMKSLEKYNKCIQTCQSQYQELRELFSWDEETEISLQENLTSIERSAAYFFKQQYNPFQSKFAEIRSQQHQTISHLIRKGMIEEARERIKSGTVDVNEPDNVGRRPLCEAAAHKNIRLMEELIRAGADVNLANTSRADGQYTPMHFVASHRSSSGLEILLAQDGIDIERRTYDSVPTYGQTPLAIAMSDGSADGCIQLMERGADPLTKVRSETALSDLFQHYNNNQPQKVLCVLDYLFDVKKIDPNTLVDEHGRTLLSSAVVFQNKHQDDNVAFQVVERIISAGANCNPENNEVRSPLDTPFWERNTAMVRFLLDHGANPLAEGKFETPLNSLFKMSNHTPEILEFLEVLFSHGISPNEAIDKEGKTLLHKALKWYQGSYTTETPDVQVDVIRTLIRSGANPEQEDSKGCSSLDILSDRELPGEQKDTLRQILENLG